MSSRALGWALAVLLLTGCGRGRPPYEGKSVAELERMLEGPDPAAQVQGAFGLGRLGAAARPAAPALMRALKSPDALVRQQAAGALGQVGAEEAVPALAEALRDAEWSVRRQAAVALGQLGSPARAAEAALRKCERDPNALVRKAAREALGKTKGEAVR
jgi:HEAT repeat protein